MTQDNLRTAVNGAAFTSLLENVEGRLTYNDLIEKGYAPKALTHA